MFGPYDKLELCFMVGEQRLLSAMGWFSLHAGSKVASRIFGRYSGAVMQLRNIVCNNFEGVSKNQWHQILAKNIRIPRVSTPKIGPPTSRNYPVRKIGCGTASHPSSHVQLGSGARPRLGRWVRLWGSSTRSRALTALVCLALF